MIKVKPVPYIIFSFIACLSLMACKKECADSYNKETILRLSEVGHWTTSANGVVRETPGIDNFNIENYPSDSAAFYCRLLTYDVNVKCYVELYDRTNNKVIANSLLTSNSTINELKISTVNFIKEFPRSTINLGCKIRSENEGTMVVITQPELRLYRR